MAEGAAAEADRLAAEARRWKGAYAAAEDALLAAARQGAGPRSTGLGQNGDKP
jgi:hypothetical protein